MTGRYIENKVYKFSTSCPGSTGNLCSADITSNTHKYLRVYGAFSLAGKLTVITTVGANVTTEALNADTNLVAGAAYMFDVPIHPGESINFRYSAASTDTTYRFIVDEYSG